MVGRNLGLGPHPGRPRTTVAETAVIHSMLHSAAKLRGDPTIPRQLTCGLDGWPFVAQGATRRMVVTVEVDRPNLTGSPYGDSRTATRQEDRSTRCVSHARQVSRTPDASPTC